ncbi:hypothetical protein ACFTQ7_16750 [Lysinibacillus sp. NPDC056959]|uniref:hypothetical protein n=1 Tax=Lysinibacillus sp. NPDC056959 TaxID=3345981 RepID=UPI00363C5234
MGKIYKALSVVLVLCLLISVSGGSLLRADEASAASNIDPVVDMAKAFDERAFELSEEEKQFYVNQFNADLESKVLVLHMNSSIKLDLENAIVSGYLNGETNEYLISVPFTDELEKGSIFTVAYNSNGDVLNTHEYQFSNIDSKFGLAQYWKNGELTFDQKVDKTKYEGGVSTKSWSCMNKCLADMGIANWVLAMIGVACAAACITVVGCAPCIQGMGIFLSFEFNHCFNKCFY